MNVGSMNVLHPPCCHYHMTYQRQLCRFTSIHKSSPMASWDSKMSIECALQNLTGSSRSFGDFSPIFFHLFLYFSVVILSKCLHIYTKLFSTKSLYAFLAVHSHDNGVLGA